LAGAAHINRFETRRKIFLGGVAGNFFLYGRDTSRGSVISVLEVGKGDVVLVVRRNLFMAGFLLGVEVG